MVDYLLIHPDGTVTEHDDGIAVALHAVGCHGGDGQALPDTRENDTVVRLAACAHATSMPEQHPENPIANGIIGALGYMHPEGWRGPIALYRDHYGHEAPLTAADIALVRELADSL